MENYYPLKRGGVPVVHYNINHTTVYRSELFDMMTGTYRLDVNWRVITVQKRSVSSANQQVKMDENAEERGVNYRYCLVCSIQTVL